MACLMQTCLLSCSVGKGKARKRHPKPVSHRQIRPMLFFFCVACSWLCCTQLLRDACLGGINLTLWCCVQGIVGTMPWIALGWLTLYLQLVGFSDLAAAVLNALLALGCALGSYCGGLLGAGRLLSTHPATLTLNVKTQKTGHMRSYSGGGPMGEEHVEHSCTGLLQQFLA